ncbi:hypothetical protein B0H13DRAFT_1552644, partial [Mycena leptocephala]
IPLLKYVLAWMHGVQFRCNAKQWWKEAIVMADLPLAERKWQLVSEPSHVSPMLTRTAGNDSTERTISAAAGTMYIGGADTTVSSLSRFVLVMMANPDEAETEVDVVMGDRYRPDFEDESSVPYVTALRRWVLRWQNVIPNGL